MELALIDDDSLYHQIFVDHFKGLGIDATIFNCGERFLSLPLEEALKYSFLVIDHTLYDMKGADCIRLLRPEINPEICVISTYGKAVPDEFRKTYNITGDYIKIEIEKISAWYLYFKEEGFPRKNKESVVML